MQPETAPVRTNTMTRNNFTKSAEEPRIDPGLLSKSDPLGL